MQKKAQISGGIITGLVMGVAGLVIAIIIAFVIVNTLAGSNLISSGRTTYSAINESGGYINNTGYTLAGATSTNYVSGTFTITSALNATDNSTIAAGNYTVSADGVVTNSTAVVWPTVRFTYTNTVKTPEEVTASSLSDNFTSGVDNVSGKVPTVLLIAAIILILTILAILVGVWQKMRMGGGSQL